VLRRQVEPEQYTCEAFARAAAELDIHRSVGRTGSAA
jgi:hypothetical protein